MVIVQAVHVLSPRDTDCTVIHWLALFYMWTTQSPTLQTLIFDLYLQCYGVCVMCIQYVFESLYLVPTMSLYRCTDSLTYR